jgi:hypothetical protein
MLLFDEDRREARPPDSPWGWSANRILALSVGLCVSVSAVDALAGRHIVLIGLLIVGPCCAVLTGRWVRTASTGAVAIGLALVLGFPDGIWGTATHLAFVGAVLVVAVVSTCAVFVSETFAQNRRGL